MLKRLFIEHPQSVGESYTEHLGVASSYGFRMIGAGFACLVHAVLPFLFVRTGSGTIVRLHDRMSARIGPAMPTAAKPANTAVPAPTAQAREV